MWSEQGKPVGVKCEKSRRQRKERKRCEKSHVLKKKNRLCYIMQIELNLDHIDVIKNECQWVTNFLIISVFSWWQRPRWASICQQPHHKCCKLKNFPHSEHNNWFWDCSLKGRLAIHRYDQSNTMNHSSIITLNYLWLQIIFKQMCRWIVFKKCRWVVFNCLDELSPKNVSMSCLVDELSRFRVFHQFCKEE